MGEVWDAERVVDAGLARALLAEQFPDLALEVIEPFGTGFDNTAYLVGGEWVLRFPRRAIAVPWLEREVRVLPAIAPRVPVRVPIPERVGRPSDAYPWPFAGYRRIEGTPAIDLDDAARSGLAEPLGRFLAALHSFPVEEARRLGAGADELRRTDVAWRAEKATREIEDARERGIVGDRECQTVRKVMTEMPRNGERPATVLVHGDLYSKHVLIGAGGELAGVIDWGDLHVGDAAIDLMIAFGFLPIGARETFRDAYGGVDDGTWRMARFRAAYHAAATVRYAAAVGDEGLGREMMRVLRGVGDG